MNVTFIERCDSIQSFLDLGLDDINFNSPLDLNIDSNWDFDLNLFNDIEENKTNSDYYYNNFEEDEDNKEEDEDYDPYEEDYTQNEEYSSDDQYEEQPKKKRKYKKRKPSTRQPKPKRKNNYNYVPVNQFPRISKKDFRRFFPDMLANIFNSNDFLLIEKFFIHFFVQDFEIIDRYNVFNLEKSILLKIKRDQLPIYFLFKSYLSPDEMMTIEKVDLVQRLNDNKTYLYIDFSVKSTRIYDVINYAVLKYTKSIQDYFNKMNSITENNVKYSVKINENYNDNLTDILIKNRTKNNSDIMKLDEVKLSKYIFSSEFPKLSNLTEKESLAHPIFIQNGYSMIPNNFKTDLIGQRIYRKKLNEIKKIHIYNRIQLIFNEHHRVEQLNYL